MITKKILFFSAHGPVGIKFVFQVSDYNIVTKMKRKLGIVLVIQLLLCLFFRAGNETTVHFLMHCNKFSSEGSDLFDSLQNIKRYKKVKDILTFPLHILPNNTYNLNKGVISRVNKVQRPLLL